MYWYKAPFFVCYGTIKSTIKICLMSRLKHLKHFWRLLNPHCVKSVLIRSYSSPHFSRIFPHSDWTRRVSLRIQSECGKIRENVDQNNSEYEQFLRSASNLHLTNNNSKYAQSSYNLKYFDLWHLPQFDLFSKHCKKLT